MIEGFLHLGSHIWLIKHLVALVQDKYLQIVKGKGLYILDQVQDTAWGSNDNMWSIFSLENLDILWDWNTSEKDLFTNFW